MADVCAICGEVGNLLFTCTLCQRPHCTSHRLPENHDCYGLNNVAKRIAGYDPENDEIIVYRSDASVAQVNPSNVDAEVVEANADHQDTPGPTGATSVPDEELATDLHERLVDVSTLLDASTEGSTDSPNITAEDFIIEHQDGVDPTVEIEQSDQIEYLTYGSTDPDFESGPDVALDGSAVYRDGPESGSSDQGRSSTLQSWLQTRTSTLTNTALKATHRVLFSLAIVGFVLLVLGTVPAFDIPNVIPDTIATAWLLASPSGNLLLSLGSLVGWWIAVRARQNVH